MKWEEGALVPLEAYIHSGRMPSRGSVTVRLPFSCAVPAGKIRACNTRRRVLLQDWPLGYDKLNTGQLLRSAGRRSWKRNPRRSPRASVSWARPRRICRCGPRSNTRDGVWMGKPGRWVLRSASERVSCCARFPARRLPTPLWKALHADALPVTTAAPEEHDVGWKDRPAHFLALATGSRRGADHTARAKTLFDELGPLYPDASAWQDLYTSVLRALPKQALQPQAHLYLAEFVGRHRDAAWSARYRDPRRRPGDGADSAERAPRELRRHDSARWHRRWLSKGCGGDTPVRCDPACLVDLGSELESRRARNGDERGSIWRGSGSRPSIGANSCSTSPRTPLPRACGAVLSVLRTLPSDEKLWELRNRWVLLGWAKPVMSAPPDEEPSAELRAMAGELLMLFRTSGGAVDWSQGRTHARFGRRAGCVIAGSCAPHPEGVDAREFGISLDNSDSRASLPVVSVVAVRRPRGSSPGRRPNPIGRSSSSSG